MDTILDYSHYKDPQVRALVWSLISPGLVTESGEYPANVSQHWCQQIYKTIQPFLEQLDKDPAPLTQWLEAHQSWRLGIRFEAYWTFILEQLQNQSEIIRYISHIQIRDHIKQTKGEMDFVYQKTVAQKEQQHCLQEQHGSQEQKQLNHLEIAVKFYLLKPDEFGFERLIGPNGCDWYERKLEHLFKKQLPLSDTKDARDKLAELFSLSAKKDTGQIACRHQGIIKGMIFFPVTGEGVFNENETRRINASCLTGTWGTIDNWYLSDPGELGRWVMLDKLNWLVPQVYSSLDDHLYTAKEMAYKLKIHFHGTRRSVLIARLDYDEQQKLWLEQQRVMVVDRYWPSFKRPSKKAKTLANEETNTDTKNLNEGDVRKGGFGNQKAGEI